MDSIISHKSNRSRRNNHTKCGEPLYRVRWYEWAEDIQEPTAHIKRTKIVPYYNKKKLKHPTEIDDAIYSK